MSLPFYKRALAFPFIVVIRLYRVLISPLLPPSCRFYPSCSHYGLLAFQLHGPFKGLYLTTRRIGRCHPFHEGGVDPVPGSDLERRVLAGDFDDAAKPKAHADHPPIESGSEGDGA